MHLYFAYMGGVSVKKALIIMLIASIVLEFKNLLLFCIEFTQQEEWKEMIWEKWYPY
jgi:hypothetical protein